MTVNEAPRQPQPFPAVDLPLQRPSWQAGQPVGQPVNPVAWFRRMPNGGGTVFLRPAEAVQND